VTRLTDFGAFVQLEEGIEGLIHISQLSEQRVRSVKDVLEPGKVIQVRVLSVDPEQRRISLSLKGLAEKSAAEPASVQAEASPAPAPRKRKKPLRGGLSW
jgi:small subunit ribosomal protein S1